MNKAILLGTTGDRGRACHAGFRLRRRQPAGGKGRRRAAAVQTAPGRHQDRPRRGRRHRPRLSAEEPRSAARSAGRARGQAEGRAAHRPSRRHQERQGRDLQLGLDGVVGNPNGKVTIVEFYDYNCGFCKRAMDDMQALTKADPDLRFVLKEFPILGPDSQKAQRRFDGVPHADAGEIRRIPQRSCSAARAAPPRRPRSRSRCRSAPTRPSCARR